MENSVSYQVKALAEENDNLRKEMANNIKIQEDLVEALANATNTNEFLKDTIDKAALGEILSERRKLMADAEEGRRLTALAQAELKDLSNRAGILGYL